MIFVGDPSWASRRARLRGGGERPRVDDGVGVRISADPNDAAEVREACFRVHSRLGQLAARAAVTSAADIDAFQIVQLCPLPAPAAVSGALPVSTAKRGSNVPDEDARHGEGRCKGGFGKGGAAQGGARVRGLDSAPSSPSRSGCHDPE